jgi:hypothetical protein
MIKTGMYFNPWSLEKRRLNQTGGTISAFMNVAYLKIQ